MKDYEGLAATEAEARKIEAESIAAEEQAQKEVDEKERYKTGVTYDELRRYPNTYRQADKTYDIRKRRRA